MTFCTQFFADLRKDIKRSTGHNKQEMTVQNGENNPLMKEYLLSRSKTELDKAAEEKKCLGKKGHIF
jgi:hypothetical protein